MKNLRTLLNLVLCLPLASCALEAADPNIEQLGAAAEEIKNGTVGWHPGVVAVYHGGVRPCSGVYMGQGPRGAEWVLTARHCVTTDGSVSGPLMSASSLWVTAQDNPGLTVPSLAFRQSKQYWQQGTQIVQRSSTTDLALLRLGAPLRYLSPITGNNLVIHASAVSINTPPSSLINKDVECAGYGRSTNLSLPLNVEDGTTGAGRARWARVRINSANSTRFTAPINSLGQTIINGDSGGPCWVVHSHGKVLVGINKSTNSPSSPTVGTFVTVAGNANANWVDNIIQGS